MGEVARQAWSGTARWVNSGAVSPAVATVFAMAGIAFDAPELGAVLGASVGAAVGSLAEGLFEANRQLWSQRAVNAERFATAAAAEAGGSLEQLLEDVSADRRRLELFAQTVEAASRALDDQKIDLLARVFVRGTRDDAAIDQTVLVLDAVRQLEPAHLRLLLVLGEVNHPNGFNSATGEYEAKWRVPDILAKDPGLTGAVEALTGKLQTLGLVTDAAIGAFVGYEPTWRLTDFGRAIQGYLAGRGQGTSAQ